MNITISRTVMGILSGLFLFINNPALAQQHEISLMPAPSIGFTQSALVGKQLINSAQYSSNRVKRNTKKKMSALKDTTRVRFQVKLKRGLGIANSDIKWTVRPVNRKGTKHKRGRETTLRLKPGRYRVTLKIGEFNKNQTITVKRSRNTVQTIPFSAKIGIVKASFNSVNVSSPDVKWSITNSKGKVISRSSGKYLNKVVGSGTYRVTARYKGKQKGRNVIVKNGQVGKTSINIPTGSIRFRAYKGKGNRQPLMQKASWSVFDAKGKRVSSSKRNSFRLTLFPGSYSVVIKTGAVKKKKTFNIRSGRNSEVVMHL